MALDLAKEIGFRGEWHFCPGGGWGVAYHEDELPDPSIESYVRGIAEAVVEGCRLRGLDLPHLHLEPGRSLVARAGVALYRVGAVKKRGGKTWLLTDGGMADNPRFALYGARYSCLPVTGLGRERPGRFHRRSLLRIRRYRHRRPVRCRKSRKESGSPSRWQAPIT